MLRLHQQCASLYVPATHKNLLDIAAGKRLAQLSSLIFCTEDAVSEADLPHALQCLIEVLHLLEPHAKQQRLIRVRNAEVMHALLQSPHIQKIDGFVLPKITANNIFEYEVLVQRGFAIMPTLETAEVFIERDMLALRDILLQEPWRSAVASLRIGGNDLLGLLGMRREAGYTLYDSVLGTHIDRLVGIFKPHGFELSAPVFEFLNDADNLRREVKQDLLHGLTGKTAIHPDQIPLIESMYQVSEQDLLMAQTLMASDKAVFQYEQRMQEYSTHYKWANKILKTVESL